MVDALRRGVDPVAMVHGLAMLMLDEQVPADELLIDAIC